MTHPDRRRYGGLDPAPPGDREAAPARFEADFAADFSADTSADVGMDTSADPGADTSPGAFAEADNATDFPANPTGPAAAGFKRRR
jgi:hypothetical protein